MADSRSSIFNEKASRKLRSPDDLDKYVRVTNPRVWTVIAACVALLGGLLAWGIFGAVSTSVETMGTVIDSQCVCFVGIEDARKISIGDQASVDGKQMAVVDVSAVPFSREEGKVLLGSDYLASTLFVEDWAYQVTLEGDYQELVSGTPLPVNITTERVAPISLIWNS